jgi:hypothetical protein
MIAMGNWVSVGVCGPAESVTALHLTVPSSTDMTSLLLLLLLQIRLKGSILQIRAPLTTYLARDAEYRKQLIPSLCIGCSSIHTLIGIQALTIAYSYSYTAKLEEQCTA